MDIQCAPKYSLCAAVVRGMPSVRVVLGSAWLASVHVHSVQIWREQRLCVCTTSPELWGMIAQTWKGLLNTCRKQWGSGGDTKHSHGDLLP